MSIRHFGVVLSQMVSMLHVRVVAKTINNDQGKRYRLRLAHQCTPNEAGPHGHGESETHRGVPPECVDTEHKATASSAVLASGSVVLHVNTPWRDVWKNVSTYTRRTTLGHSDQACSDTTTSHSATGDARTSSLLIVATSPRSAGVAALQNVLTRDMHLATLGKSTLVTEQANA